MVYLALEQEEKAIEDFSEAIRIKPENAFNYILRSATYTWLGMDTEAELDFQQAVELGTDPEELRMHIDEIKEKR